MLTADAQQDLLLPFEPKSNTLLLIHTQPLLLHLTAAAMLF
jgi:hypothetical protein